MLTEVILTQAVKAALGYGFSQVVKGVLAHSNGLSDREILDRLVFELRRQGAQIGDVDTRLARLEGLVESAMHRLPPASPPAWASRIGVRPGQFCRNCGAVPGEASKCA